MIPKILTTLILLLLGVNAFWSDALGAGNVFNPFGLLFLLLAAFVWFAWGPISNGFNSVKDEIEYPDPSDGFKNYPGYGKPAAEASSQ